MRLKAESGNQDRIIAGGHECMHAGHHPVLAPFIKPDRQKCLACKACCPALISHLRAAKPGPTQLPKPHFDREETGGVFRRTVVQKMDDKERPASSTSATFSTHSRHVHRPRCGQNLTLRLPENNVWPIGDFLTV